MRISIVIPTLDEAARLGGLLDELLARGDFAQIIVVDGGSDDDTTAVAARPGVTVLSAPRGRALQMNAGAATADGEALLFLHADTRPPPDAAAQIRAALADPAVVGGAFRTRTVLDAPGRRWVGALLPLADLRSRYTRLPYGDQGIFVRAEVFRALGGFPEIPLMEDLSFSRRLARRGRLTRAPGPIQVSGRRFAARPLYYFILMNLFPALYSVGVSPWRLAALYGRER